MKIFYKIIAGFCACFFLIVAAYADTIVLKSGKTLEGKIVEQVNDYVKIDVEGTVLTYFNDEIDKIVNGSIVSAQSIPEVAAQVVSVPEQQLPFNPAEVVAPVSKEDLVQTVTPNPVEGFTQEPAKNTVIEPVEAIAPSLATEVKGSGFEIQAPQGWFTSSMAIGASGNQNTNIRYTKEPEGKIGSIPQISVVMDSLPEGENISTPCDFAKYILVKWKKVVEAKSGALNILEDPSPVEVNGVAGCGVVVERKTASGKILKIIDFKFIKDKTAISIQCMDWLESFNSSIPDFETALNSFKFK